jgi:hypothetical protein
MFKVEEVNCICVDWKKGSQTTYTQAANNARVVGAQVAQMLHSLSVSPSEGQAVPLVSTGQRSSWELQIEEI